MLKTVTNSINASQIQTPITLPGNVTLSTGNLIIGTSGKGIDFSATPGTGTSELLADYEEGTFTPIVQGSTSAGVGVYSNQYGYYTKIGNVVWFHLYCQWTATTGTGDIQIAGLPFTCANNTQLFPACNVVGDGLTFANQLSGLVVSNTSYINLATLASGAGLAFVPMDISAGAYITGMYKV